MDYTDLSHALIQFVTDNELRIRLNPEESYPPFVGHDDLFPLMEQALPYWKTYLTETTPEGKKDIHAFQDKLRQLPQFQEKIQEPPKTPAIE